MAAPKQQVIVEDISDVQHAEELLGTSRATSARTPVQTPARPDHRSMSTKEQILAWKAQIDQLKKTEYKDMMLQKEQYSIKITRLFKRLQDKEYDGVEEFEQINNEMGELSAASKKLEKKYEKKMRKRFPEFVARYVNIFEMFIKEKVDERTLDHVLNTFDRMEKGRLSADQGLNQGLNYLTNKYNLPSDFFTRTN